MAALNISLFGKFRAETEDGSICSIHGAKVRELFTYLLLNYNRPLLREALATLFWSNLSGAQSKGYLRKTVWQLQVELSQLNASPDSHELRFLSIEADWIQLSTGDELWLDVAQFEAVYKLVEDVAGHNLTNAAAQRLAAAVNLYRSTLLEGWYQDWCILERERLEQMCLVMLEKLILHCATQGKYEAGIGFGSQALRLDPLRERTYRRLMQLHYLAGNLPEALHQYTLCAAILQKELNVQPSERTAALYSQIISGEFRDSIPSPAIPSALVPNLARQSKVVLVETLLQWQEMRRSLAEAQQMVQRNINRVEAQLARPVESV